MKDAYGMMHTYYPTARHSWEVQGLFKACTSVTGQQVAFGFLLGLKLMGFCWDGPWRPPSLTPTLWEMDVDSVSAFSLEALIMNPKHWIPSSSYKAVMAASFLLRGLDKNHGLLFPVPGCPLVLRSLWCKETFWLIFHLHEMFQMQKAKLMRLGLMEGQGSVWVSASVWGYEMSWVTVEACSLEFWRSQSISGLQLLAEEYIRL
jgi:hypothetical protein